MLKNAYFLAKIGADTAETEQHFAEILPIGRRREQRGRGARLRVALRRRAGRAPRARHRGGARRAAGAAGLPAVQGAAMGTNSWLISRNDKMIN